MRATEFDLGLGFGEPRPGTPDIFSISSHSLSIDVPAYGYPIAGTEETTAELPNQSIVKEPQLMSPGVTFSLRDS